jgi:acetylornithine/succinyldiaminopimelate/putrescine aminotransferase
MSVLELVGNPTQYYGYLKKCLNENHGRTMATLSATGNDKVQAGFAPLVSEFIHFDFNDVDAMHYPY